MQCSECGRAVPARVKFCPGCGAQVAADVAETCLHCGAARPPGARFCKQCGQAFVGGTATPTLLASPVSNQIPAPSHIDHSEPAPPAVTDAPAPGGHSNTCPHCGARHAPGAKFCKTCGMAFAMVESAASVVRREDLALTSIPDVALTSPAALEGRAAPPGPSAVDGAGTPPNLASVPGDWESGRNSDVAPELSVPSEPAAASDEPASGSAVQPEIANGGVTRDLPRRVEQAAFATQVPAEVPPLLQQRRESNRIPGWLMGVVAAALVVVVGGGAFAAYYKFFRSVPQTTAAASSTATGSVAPQASATIQTTSAVPGSSSIEMVPVAPPASTVESTAIAPVASAQAQAVSPSPIAPSNLTSGVVAAQLPKSRAAAQTPPAITQQAVPAARPIAPKRTVARAPAPPPVDRSLEVASRLVSTGEGAFNRQDYSTAIANANAALEVHPGYSRAERLLREARAAQRQAMNSITIH